jgi:hypothetical protein
MPTPFDTASTPFPPPSYPRIPHILPSDFTSVAALRTVTYHLVSHMKLLHFTIMPVLSTSKPLPPSHCFGTCLISQRFSRTWGSTISQGLVGSVYDTDWESSVPQAASTEGWGKGTYMALVGLHPVLNLIIS